MERTPAKTRKTKRELEGTPDTPQTPHSPTSDTDIMSPPPVKRTKSRRGLGPLMEQQQNVSDSRSIPVYHTIHKDENAFRSSGIYEGDENKFTDFQRPQRPVPTSSLHSRVLRNTENIQSPTKSQGYRGFDIDGIKPLLEMEEQGLTPLIPVSEVHTSSEPKLLLTESEIFGLSYPTPELNSNTLVVPPNHVLKEGPVTGNLPWSEGRPSTEATDGGLLMDLNKKQIPEVCQQDYIPQVVLSLPISQSQSLSTAIVDEPQKLPAEEESSQEKLPRIGETWRLRQPKKRWLLEAQLEQEQPRHFDSSNTNIHTDSDNQNRHIDPGVANRHFDPNIPKIRIIDPNIINRHTDSDNQNRQNNLDILNRSIDLDIPNGHIDPGIPHRHVDLEVPARHIDSDIQTRPSVLVKASPVPQVRQVDGQPQVRETKDKWMGAMALIQLAEVSEEGAQPLNLSTARYTML